MDSYFAGLTKRQAMLLLTAVTFGGQEGVESFDCLPDDEGELLRDRARQILSIPRDKRVPFLVQEIKRFITANKLEVLRFADPKKVAEALAKERPAMVEVILRALPSSVAQEVRTALAQPVVELRHEVRRDVLAIIRWKFEEKLATSMPDKAAFSLSDLLVMPSRDLTFVADVLGAKALSQLLVCIPEAERDPILKQLAPEQRQIASRPPNPDQGPRRTTPERAKEILDRTFKDIEPRRAVRLMGVRRIAKACLCQNPEFASRVIEQHRDEFGRELAHFVSEERRKGNRGDTNARDEVLAELEQWATRGMVDKPLRLPPPPMAKKPAHHSVRDLETGPRRGAAARVPGRPPAPPPPRASSPTIQRGGAAASSHSAREIPVRSTILRPTPARGPRKP